MPQIQNNLFLSLSGPPVGGGPLSQDSSHPNVTSHAGKATYSRQPKHDLKFKGSKTVK